MQSHLFAGADISASGMSAERQRMEVVANNIANANATQTAEGGPYRRQQLVFSAALDETGNASGLRGVEVLGIQADNSELPRIHNPGHPHADEDGYVLMPNVKMPNEMVDLITASRSYEANLKALTTFKQMIEQTLQLLRGGR
jgi:flagellar basal-body rod protein FlgC